MPARGLLKAGHHGGAGNCLACQLSPEDQARLHADLLTRVPLSRISKRWNINREALRNHKANHITPALTALRTERITTGIRKVVERVEEDLVVETGKMYAAAKKVGNMQLALKAVHEQRGNLELVARLTGELDDRPEVVVNIQSSPVWIAIRSVVFSVLEPHPELRAEISRRLRVLADDSEDEAPGARA
jgi:hypothetical protein